MVNWAHSFGTDVPISCLARRQWRRRGRPVLRAEISDQLSDLLVRHGIAEGRHFGAAIENLVGDLGRGPNLVLPQIDQGGSLFCTDSAITMTVGTTFVAKQQCTCLFRRFGAAFGGGSDERAGWDGCEQEDTSKNGEAL